MDPDAIRPAIYCACGAQWHGKYADPQTNTCIDTHRITVGCRFITEAEYHRRYPRKQAARPRLTWRLGEVSLKKDGA